MPQSRRTAVIAAALGAAAAVLSDNAARRLFPTRHTALLAVALPAAAAIYPLARTDWHDTCPAKRELLGLAGFTAIGALGAARTETNGNRIAAGGWLAHAVFDAVHERGNHSRIPGWYPSMCAGYDVALAALLIDS